MGMCCEKKMMIGWRNVWKIKYRVQDQEEDQRGPGERLYERIVKHVKWTKRMPLIVVNGGRWCLPAWKVSAFSKQQQRPPYYSTQTVNLCYIHTYTHTHTHMFNGPLSGTTRVSRYQKGKTNLDFTEARDSEWQWHQLGYMQVCTLLQTDNHTSNPPLSFLQAGCPSCHPTNSIKALKG